MIDNDGMEHWEKRTNKEIDSFMEFMKQMDSISKTKKCSCTCCNK